MKSIRLQGIYVGSREMFEQMNRAISFATLRPHVDQVFDFEEVSEAMRHMESRTLRQDMHPALTPDAAVDNAALPHRRLAGRW
jgi:D-arabinose 1-dehydrogenase-like Zn-dependent alcohol dehydrogenase